MSDSLSRTTARTLKWNTIDRLGSQVVLASIGIVLANKLNHVDFGLIGVLGIFQAFALILVDSGFGAAILRKKDASQADYSTVFWFNLAVSLALYAALWALAPLIAEWFQGDPRLVPLSKVMFLAFVINGLSIVQTNRLMKLMDVKQIAVSNSVGLTLGGVLGVWLAATGHGAWSLVWMTVTQAAVRSGWLWVTAGWWPSMVFSRRSLSEIWRVGVSVLTTQFLNTLFLNVYSFVIGIWYSLGSLGLYTQADKWSKMGSASLSQTLTSTFVPLLARVQDDGAAFRRYVRRIDRFTAFVAFPVLGGMALIGQPLFHTLFGHKWDGAIVLFQILAVRGLPVVAVSVFANYFLALGYGRQLVVVEAAKDLMMVFAILATVWQRSVSLLVWGQLAASLASCLVVACIFSRKTGISIGEIIRPVTPFLAAALAMAAAVTGMLLLSATIVPWIRLLLCIVTGGGAYLLPLRLMRTPEISQAWQYVKSRK